LKDGAVPRRCGGSPQLPTTFPHPDGGDRCAGVRCSTVGGAHTAHARPARFHARLFCVAQTRWAARTRQLAERPHIHRVVGAAARLGRIKNGFGLVERHGTRSL